MRGSIDAKSYKNATGIYRCVDLSMSGSIDVRIYRDVPVPLGIHSATWIDALHVPLLKSTCDVSGSDSVPCRLRRNVSAAWTEELRTSRHAEH